MVKVSRSVNHYHAGALTQPPGEFGFEQISALQPSRITIYSEAPEQLKFVSQIFAKSLNKPGHRRLLPVADETIVAKRHDPTSV